MYAGWGFGVAEWCSMPPTVGIRRGVILGVHHSWGSFREKRRARDAVDASFVSPPCSLLEPGERARSCCSCTVDSGLEPRSTKLSFLPRLRNK